MSPTSTSAPPWRQPRWGDDPAAGPREHYDSRGNWAERVWGRAVTWVGALQGNVLEHLPWRNYPAVFGEKTLSAMVEARDAAQALVERFAEDDSITVVQVIEAIDKCVEVWATAVYTAKAAGRFRGKTVRELSWCS